MLVATNEAKAEGHCQVPAALSGKPMKCSTRHDATASMGDHEVPASAWATVFNRLGTASFSVSALAISWATRARLGVPANTVFASPGAPEVHPVPAPGSGMVPHEEDGSPMLQVQFGPGSIPSASTWATRDATTATSGVAVVEAGAGLVVGTTGAVVGVTTVATGAEGAVAVVVAGTTGGVLAVLVEGATAAGALVSPETPVRLNGRESRADAVPIEGTEWCLTRACPDEGSRALVRMTADKEVRMATTMMARR
jgi:hypothetical protein